MYTFIQTGRFFFLLSSKIIAITARFRTNNWGFVNKPGSAQAFVCERFVPYLFISESFSSWMVNVFFPIVYSFIMEMIMLSKRLMSSFF